MKRMAVFASGSGTNAENIIRYFKDHKDVRVDAVYCNNPAAGVLRRAENHNIASILFNRQEMVSGTLLSTLKKRNTDILVLAGFLWLVPSAIIQEYKGRIVNIHPALLPSFGGKGFYGEKVHQAVIESGTPMSGITVHHVNEKFDEGAIIFQAACHVTQGETAGSLAEKIHELEYRYYPVVLEKFLALN